MDGRCVRHGGTVTFEQRDELRGSAFGGDGDGQSRKFIVRHCPSVTDVPAYADEMITAVHTLVYADDAEAARDFFRDVLGWDHVDAGGGWLIFRTGPSEMGVHPTSDDRGGEPWSTQPHHEISLVCDDIEATVAELKAKGAEFTRDVRDGDTASPPR